MTDDRLRNMIEKLGAMGRPDMRTRGLGRNRAKAIVDEVAKEFSDESGPTVGEFEKLIRKYAEAVIVFIFRGSSTNDPSGAELGGRRKSSTSDWVSSSAIHGSGSISLGRGGWSLSASAGEESTSASHGDCSNSSSSGQGSKAASVGEYVCASSAGRDSRSAGSGKWNSSASAGSRSFSESYGDNGTSASAGGGSYSESYGNKVASASAGGTSISGGEFNTSASAGEGSRSISRGRSGISASAGERSTSDSYGDRSLSASAGDYCRSSCAGKNSIASAIGYMAAVKGELGCLLMAAEYRKIPGGGRIPIGGKAGIVDGKVLKPDCWYIVREGKWVEANLIYGIYAMDAEGDLLI